MIMLINGVQCSTLVYREVPWAAFRASFRASIWAVIFTQCATTKMAQIDLLNASTGLLQAPDASRSSPESETTLARTSLH
jgi:hypothetical protein